MALPSGLVSNAKLGFGIGIGLIVLGFLVSLLMGLLSRVKG